MQRKGILAGGLLLGLALTLGLSLGLTRAEEPTATLKGVVVDPNGEALPGVQLQLTQNGGGFQAKQVTNEEGKFEFAKLQPATYTFEAFLAGFESKKIENLSLVAGEIQQATVRLKLESTSLSDGADDTAFTTNKRKEVGGKGDAHADGDKAGSDGRTDATTKSKPEPAKPQGSNGLAKDVFASPATVPATTEEAEKRESEPMPAADAYAPAPKTANDEAADLGAVQGQPAATRPISAPVRGVLGKKNEESDEPVLAEPLEANRLQERLKQQAPQSGEQEFNTEAYDRIEDNPFLAVGQNPLSTFSIDVDTASYSKLRSTLEGGFTVVKDAVRIEELINYFPYDYPQPDGAAPFSVNVETAQTPWALEHRLVRIGLKGREIAAEKRPPLNLVFLLDVSGSMDEANKLPLVKASLKLLAERLQQRDRVAIVVYAGSSGLVLPPTHDKRAVLAALGRLLAGGSTNGGEGIELAYKVAQEGFVEGGSNRVILCTDGDFNVGVSDEGSLTRLIEQKAKGGVFLSVLGFGMGNYKDATLEKLADKGNGNYAYIDTLKEARKVLVEQLSGTLVTIAKDVKIQVEFNPALVSGYRLIGYENRMLRAEDFNDDKKDAGEIGAGHTVTALYEVVPAGQALPTAGKVDALKYQKPAETAAPAAASGELLTVKLRYKEPQGDTSQLIERPVTDEGHTYEQASPDFQWTAAVAAFGMILRDSPYKGSATFDSVLELGEEGKGADKEGYRAEFLKLVARARDLKK